MNTTLKYGLIAAAAGLGIYSIVKSNKEEEENQAQLQQMQLALQAAQTPQITETYGDWREITQKGRNVDFWNMPAPKIIEGKSLINLAVEVDGIEPTKIGALAYHYDNGTFGVLLVHNYSSLSVKLRIKATWL